MSKRCREEDDSNGTASVEAMASFNPVFIDTSLDTHMVLIVSDSDTVSDLKEKIAVEHLRCFPEMRKLKISSVKVQRDRHCYHLPDGMVVKTVFQNINSDWFLYVDALSCLRSENNQGLLCITHTQTEAGNLLPPFDTDLASSSVPKQEVTKVIDESKSVKPLDNSRKQLSPVAAPVAKKRKMKHKEDVTNHPISDTHTSNHVIDVGVSEFKLVGGNTASTNSNEGERRRRNMKSKDVGDERIRKLPSGHYEKNCMTGGAVAEISGVQDEQFGSKNNEALDETLHSGTNANNVKKMGGKESSRGSGEFNHKNDLTIAIPENSAINRPIKAPLAETLEDSSVRTNTAHKKEKKKKKGKDSPMCHNEVGLKEVAASNDNLRDNNPLLEPMEMDVLAKNANVDVSGAPLETHSTPSNHFVQGSNQDKNVLPTAEIKGGIVPVEEKGIEVEHLPVNQTDKDLEKESLVEKKPKKKSRKSQIASKKSKSVTAIQGREVGLEEVAALNDNLIDNNPLPEPMEMDVLAKNGNVDASGAPLETCSTPSNHFVQGSNQDKNVLPTAEIKEVIVPVEEKVIEVEHLPVNQTDKDLEIESLVEKKPKKKSRKSQGASKKSKSVMAIQGHEVSLEEVAGSNYNLIDNNPLPEPMEMDVLAKNCNVDVSGAPLETHSTPNQFVQGSNQDKNVLPTAETKEVIVPAEEKGIEVEQLSVNQTNKDLEIESLVEKKPKKKSRKSQSASKKSKSVTAIQGHEVGLEEVEGSNDNLINNNPLLEPMEMDVLAKYGNVDVSGAPLETHSTPSNHFVQGSNQDKNVLPTAEINGVIVPAEEKGIEVEHLPVNQTDKDLEIESLVEKKTKKKSRKSQTASTKSKSVAAIQGQEVGLEEVAASNDNLIDNNPLTEPMEMGVSAKNGNVNQLDVTKLKNQRSPDTGSNSKSSGKVIQNSDLFLVPPHSLAKATSEEIHEPEVNTDKSESIDFRLYFIPDHQRGEVNSKKPMKSNKDVKGSRESKNRVNSGSVKEDNTVEEAGKLATFDAPTYKKENKKSIDESMSSSISRGYNRAPDQAGTEVQSLAARNTKMRTRKGVKSGSSTETPSDSSSSGYSVEGSEISQASTPTGVDGAKSKNAGAKHKGKSNLLGQNVTLDVILKSSTRFKKLKAKVTASQCEEDEQSQPVDVVPDSLADAPN